MSVVELEEFRKAMRHDPDFNKLWRKMSLPQRKAFYRYTVKMAAERYAGCGYGGENASMQAITDYECTKNEYNRLVASGEIEPDEDFEREQAPPVRILQVDEDDDDAEVWKIPTAMTSDTSLFFLPPSAVRRRTKAEKPFFLYCINLSARKRRKWVITFYQVNNDAFNVIGEIVVTSESELNSAMRPAEFCIDEVNEYLYQLNWTTSKTMISAHQLSWQDDALILVKNGPDNGRQFVKDNAQMNIVYCSNFCIRQQDPLLFAFAIVEPDTAGDPKAQSVTIACGVRIDESSDRLVYPDDCFLIKEPKCCVARTVLPELWAIWRDNIVGNLRPPITVPACFADRQLFIAPFDWAANINQLIAPVENESDDDDPNTPMPSSVCALDESMPTSSSTAAATTHFETNSNTSSSVDSLSDPEKLKSMSSFCVEQLRLLLLVETRLIGRWDKWLVFQHKGEANILTVVRLLSESDMAERAFGGQYLLQMTIDLQAALNKALLKQENVMNMWIDAENMLCIQTRSKVRSGVFYTAVHRIDCSDLLLDARQCATCGMLEDKKYLINERARQSTFKVCRICKKHNLHKNWLANSCHFCSMECFQNGWVEHKKLHFFIS